MDKFDVYVKRKKNYCSELEFSNVDSIYLIVLVSVLCDQQEIEYFTLQRSK